MKVPLTKGYFAVIGRSDFPLVKRFKWHADVHKNTVYASTSVCINGKRKELRMHTLLTRAAETDHIDGNGLNNLRSNLRSVTHQQNTWNSKALKNGAGVTKVKRLKSRPWHARIIKGGKQVHLGYYSTRKEARSIYQKAAYSIRGGDFAPIPSDVPIKDSGNRQVICKQKIGHCCVADLECGHQISVPWFRRDHIGTTRAKCRICV